MLAHLRDEQQGVARGCEQLLKQWGEMFIAYSWMHDKAQRRTVTLNYACIVAPTLVANTIALSLSFISSNILCDERHFVATTSVAGVTNVIAIILTLLESTLRLSDVAGNHRECSGLFSKVGRMIQAELSIPKRDRLMDGYDFLRMISADVDRIIAMNVLIPQSVVDHFKKRFREPDDLMDILVAAGTPSPGTPGSTDSETLHSRILEMRRTIDELLGREEERIRTSPNFGSHKGLPSDSD
jgi:hypothetical protein